MNFIGWLESQERSPLTEAAVSGYRVIFEDQEGVSGDDVSASVEHMRRIGSIGSGFSAITRIAVDNPIYDVAGNRVDSGVIIEILLKDPVRSGHIWRDVLYDIPSIMSGKSSIRNGCVEPAHAELSSIGDAVLSEVRGALERVMDFNESSYAISDLDEYSKNAAFLMRVIPYTVWCVRLSNGNINDSESIYSALRYKGEVRDVWLFHSTDHSEEVFSEGFLVGSDLLNLAWSSNSNGGNIGFAFTFEDDPGYIEGGLPYGQEAIAFIGSGVVVSHKYDNSDEVLFDIRKPDSCFLVSSYMYSSSGENSGTSKSGWHVYGKDHKILFTDATYKGCCSWIIHNGRNHINDMQRWSKNTL